MDNKSKAPSHSIFTKRTDQNVKLSSESEQLESGGTYSNIIDKMKGYVRLGASDVENEKLVEENLGIVAKVKKCLVNTFEVEKSYKLFFIFLAVGLSVIFLSLIFLPVVWISPRKFVSLFSLGSFISLISFVFIYGTSAYLEMLFSKSRALFSVLFILSIFTGVYFAFNETYYLISLICAVIQLITLIVFTLSFIPGGSHGISFIWSMITSPFNNLWNRIKGINN